MLVDLRYKGRDNEKILESFVGGINQREYKKDGDIAFMENMSSISYPCLKPRGTRSRILSTDTAVTGLYSGNELFYTKDKGDGTAEFYYGGELIEGLTLTAGEKTFVTLGDFIIIHPDMKYYFTGKVEGVYEDEYVYYEAKDKDILVDALWVLEMSTREEEIPEGAYYEAGGAIYRYNGSGTMSTMRKPENGNTNAYDPYRYVRLAQSRNPNSKWIYQCAKYGTFTARRRVNNNDDVSVTTADGKIKLVFEVTYTNLGDIKVGDNLKIICEKEDGDGNEYVSFVGYVTVEKMSCSASTDKDTWILSLFSGLSAEMASASRFYIEREYPDMDGVFECNMRLWGYKGDSIYASALGNPFAFNVYATELDGYSIDTETAGKLTGGCNFAGYPTFFKEDYIFRITGGIPSDFCLSVTPSPGYGCIDGRSIQCFGTKMIYLSPSGFVLYQGALPSVISSVLSDVFVSAVSGFDGRRYYATTKTTNNKTDIYVFDTDFGVWYREDGKDFNSYTYHENVLYAASSDGIYAFGDKEEGEREGTVSSIVEFAPFNEVYLEKKVLKKISLRYKTSSGAKIKIFSKENGEWSLKREISEDSEGTSFLQIMPRRGDSYSLRLEGTGDYVIYALSREYALRSKK